MEKDKGKKGEQEPNNANYVKPRACSAKKRGARTARTLVETRMQVTKKGVPMEKADDDDRARKRKKKKKKGVHGKWFSKPNQVKQQETEIQRREARVL